MDDIVLRGMARWPNVPNAFGWLALDARGQWLIKGDRIANPAVTAFIGRNYAADSRGRWYFQNGPQRVFVALAITPFVFRTAPDGGLVAHTGHPVSTVTEAWLDDAGRLGVGTELGPGIVDDRDLAAVCSRLVGPDGPPCPDDALEAWFAGESATKPPHLEACGARVQVQRMPASALPARFGFDPLPRPDPGEPEC